MDGRVISSPVDSKWTDFIRRWKAGEPRAQVWREAQSSLLRSSEFAHPYCWAAFTLTGQWRQGVVRRDAMAAGAGLAVADAAK